MLEVGDVFLNEIDLKRLSQQDKWKKLWTNNYITQIALPFQLKSFNTNKTLDKRVDPLVPLPSLVSNIYSDLLFLKFPEIDFQDESLQKELKPVIKKLKLPLLETAAANSAMGMMFWFLHTTPSGKVRWSFEYPDRAKWEKDENGKIKNIYFFDEIVPKGERDRRGRQFNTQFLGGDNLSTVMTRDRIKDTQRLYIVQQYELVNSANRDEPIEEDTPTDVLYSKYGVLVDEVGPYVVKAVFANEEKGAIIEKSLDVEFIPIVPIINEGRIGHEIGMSDYYGKEQLFAEYDNRLDQINETLQEHADPFVGLPPGILGPTGDFIKTNGKYFEKNTGGNADNTIDFFTWDASLKDAFESLTVMRKNILLTCRISSPIAGDETQSAPESGIAVKWRSVNTFSAVAKKRLYWEEAIVNFFRFYFQLSGIEESKADDILIEWADSLPLDEMSNTEVNAAQVGAGIRSKLTAIQKVNRVDKDKAQEELSQIETEQTSAADIASREVTGGITL